MGEKSRVGRPAKNTIRVELRLDADDRMTEALQNEAKARRVPLQRHITDILIARYFGQDGAPRAVQPQQSTDTATQLAGEWM